MNHQNYEPTSDCLIQAIQKKDIDSVREMLTRNPLLVTSTVPEGPTPIISTTPFWAALESKQPEIVELLVQAGADVNERYLFEKNNCYGLTFLQSLAHLNDAWEDQRKTVEILIKFGAGLVDANHNCVDANPLELALDNDNLPYAQFLLESGAKVEEVTFNQSALIQRVIRKKKPDQEKLLELLIDRGLDIKIRCKKGRNCLQMLIAYVIRKRDHDVDLLKIAKILLDARVPIDALDSKGFTALLLACALNNSELISFFIGAGANVNVKAKKLGLFPLYYAARYDNLEAAELLVSKGADVNETVASGDTALYAACRRSSGKFIKFLINNGATVGMVNKKGKTPFGYAVEFSVKPLDESAKVIIKEIARLAPQNDAVFDIDVARILDDQTYASYYRKCLEEFKGET